MEAFTTITTIFLLIGLGWFAHLQTQAGSNPDE